MHPDVQQDGGFFTMTNLGDVIRQIETALSDSRDPPTPHEREVFHRILTSVYTGAVDAKGSW